MLTKSDFLLYRDSPAHLWASQHNRLERTTPSDYDRHLMTQGYQVEKMAYEHIQKYILPKYEQGKLLWQEEFTDGEYYARADAVIYDSADNVIDIFEIKSSTSVDKNQILDAAFQTTVCLAKYEVRHIYILHLNKDYIKTGELDLHHLFTATNKTEDVFTLLDQIKVDRDKALRVASKDNPRSIDTCVKPDTCPCPSLCHPNLPKHHIFEIPRINGAKSQDLKEQGIVAITDIPDDYPLSSKQRAYVDVVKLNAPKIKSKSIGKQLGKLVYPLHFLDYETYNLAIPEFDGYHPQQQITFQYSLHVIESPASEPKHFEYLSINYADPTPGLLESLTDDIGDTGSVIVWNKTFECGRNTELATMYPEYGDKLNSINKRVFDLMEIFSKGLYIHPDFHGSASIKNVLSVLVPNLTYKGLPIGKGDQAMLAWWKIIHDPKNNTQTIKDLLAYCKLDTLAMVKIWDYLKTV